MLKKTLGPVTLWALGVGYVISGMYFGWNLGLEKGGPYGLGLATVLVTVMYLTFVMGYAELACAIPKAGGAFAYATRALSPRLGLLAGLAQCLEFIFAPPAIAAAIGAYAHLYSPQLPALGVALAAYLAFTALNIWGVKQSALFELVITVLAVGELLLFAGLTLPHFRWEHFAQDPLPNGWAGTVAALPFAIWFYLAIEGVANVAEEAVNPQRDIQVGFGSSLLTLIFLAATTFAGAVGVNGWHAVVFPPGETTPSDSPLPLALSHVVGADSPFFHLLIGIGLCGLLASFHGILLVAGRSTMEFGRTGYGPAWLGETDPARHTPKKALLCNMAIGILALLTGKTGDIIVLSVMGALLMYVLAMVSLIRLRQREPELERPFRTPLYPLAPVTALVLSAFCLASMLYENATLGAVFAGLLALGMLGATRSRPPG